MLVFEDEATRRTDSLETVDGDNSAATSDEESVPLPPAALSLPQIVSEINRNVERTHKLGEYLAHIKPEDLQNHRELIGELKHIDALIGKLSATIQGDDDEYMEEMYREALVKVMQDCHFYWQKVTGESIIDLAEKSRIWSVSVDNGRLRTRSMNTSALTSYLQILVGDRSPGQLILSFPRSLMMRKHEMPWRPLLVDYRNWWKSVP